ncbi:hypothetical protein Bbelb_366230 [Branchiostoma belcheri]|nr:hypothetical protein Bbelb_366230 [Branchiostoma belcheri]
MSGVPREIGALQPSGCVELIGRWRLLQTAGQHTTSADRAWYESTSQEKAYGHSLDTTCASPLSADLIPGLHRGNRDLGSLRTSPPIRTCQQQLRDLDNHPGSGKAVPASVPQRKCESQEFL